MGAHIKVYEETCKDLNPWLLHEKIMFNTDYLDKHFWKTIVHNLLSRIC